MENDSNTNIENTPECFQYLKDDDLEFLKDKKKRIEYFKGETIFKQGAFAPYVLYVIEGLVKVYLQTGPGKQVNIRLVKKGDFLAFPSIFGGKVHTYSTSALKDSRICMIDKEALKQLLLKNPEFALEITSRNCKNESIYIDIIQNLTYKQMRGKLATALLYLSEADFLKEDVFHYMTRQDIADFASITLESAIKFLKEFEKEDLIMLEKKNIRILNFEVLRDIGKKG